MTTRTLFIISGVLFISAATMIGIGIMRFTSATTTSAESTDSHITDTPNTVATTQAGTTQASAAPVSTKDWTVLTSQEFGFSIKYPKRLAKDDFDWVVKEESNAVAFMVPNFTPGALGIAYKPETKNKTIRSWVVTRLTPDYLERSIETTGTSLVKNPTHTRQDITVDGKPAILVTTTSNEIGGLPWTVRKVYIVHNAYLYIIENGLDTSLVGYDEETDKDLNIVEDLPTEFEAFYKSFKIL